MTQAGKEEGKSLEDLLQTSPEDLPEDPDELAALIAQSSAAEPAEKTAGEPEAKPEETPAVEPKGEEPAKPEAKPEERPATDKTETKPEGVMLKDGKTVIPYHVLEATRRREDAERRAREAAEAKAREAQERAEALTAQVEALKRGGDGVVTDTQTADALRDQIAALKESVPEFGPVLDALVARLEASDAKLTEIAKREEEEQQRRAAEVAERVQAAVDANPVLRYLQNENAELYAAAVGFDQQLRANPEWQGKPMAERFSKVVELVETLHGKVDLPEGYRPKTQTPPAAATSDPKGSVKKDVQASPKAKPEQPLSLSDLPGGVPPTTERAVDEMSVGDLDAHIAGLLDRGTKPQDVLAALDLIR